MERKRDIKTVMIEQDARVLGANANIERVVLSTLLVLFYVTYGALGRDIFFNHLNDAWGAAIDDPIGAKLPYARLFVCATAFIVVTARTDLNWTMSKVPWMLTPFCVLALLSCLWAADPKPVLRTAALTTIMWICISPLIHRLGLVTTTRVTLFVISVVCILSVVLALAFPLIGRHSGLEMSQTSHVGEWRGIFGHKNGLGPWAAWGTVFLFTHSWICRGPRIYWWFAGACALTCLLLANSATGLIMAFVCLYMQFLFSILRRMSLTSFMTIALFLLVVGGALFLILQDELFALVGRDATFTGRTGIWSVSLDYALEQPWLGHGFQQMGGEYLAIRLHNIYGQPLGPENGYISLFLDLGIIGLIAFFVPYVIALKNGFEWIKHVKLIDRSCLELQLSVLIATLVASITMVDIMLSTGFDGIFSFIALFALLTTPKSPEGVLRGEFRLAKHRLPPQRLIRTVRPRYRTGPTGELGA